MDNGTPRIAAAGICCLDHIIVAPQVKWGDTASVTGYLSQGGGLAATAVVACARLGAQCEFFSLLGDDPIGEEIVSELCAEGVSVSGVQRTIGGGSPFSFIHVDANSGERTIFHRGGVGLNWVEDNLDAISKCGALLVDDYYPDLALAASKVAREHNVPVIADLQPQPHNQELLRFVDILIAPRHYVRAVGCDDSEIVALQRILELGPHTAMITLGADGWVYSTGTAHGSGKAFSVDVVDTTGAGDTFHGAFAYGVAMKWEIERCAEFAAAVAAIKCTVVGGRTGLPSLEQTLRFLRQRSKLEW